MQTMASVHQASEIAEGDRVTREGGSMEGTVKRILDLGYSNGGIPMASVDWDSGATGKVTVRDLKKVTKKTAADAPKGFKVVPSYAREREAWGFPAPKRMLSCTKCHKRMWDVYDNASKHRSSHLPAGHPDKIIGT